MTESLIGGGETRAKFSMIYALGALVGTVIRVGMWTLPNSFVEKIIDQL